MATTKTPEFYLDEVAKEKSHDQNFSDFMFEYEVAKYEYRELIDIVKEAMLRHSKEACEEQRKLCADAAKMNCDNGRDMLDGHVCNYGEYTIHKQSIINAKSPIE